MSRKANFTLLDKSNPSQAVYSNINSAKTILEGIATTLLDTLQAQQLHTSSITQTTMNYLIEELSSAKDILDATNSSHLQGIATALDTLMRQIEANILNSTSYSANVVVDIKNGLQTEINKLLGA